jgi:hypothetical protein
MWTERYHCPTWLDYLRWRNRSTRSERILEQRAIHFHVGPAPIRVRRMLERPFGSVHSNDDATEYAAGEMRGEIATPTKALRSRPLRPIK